VTRAAAHAGEFKLAVTLDLEVDAIAGVLVVSASGSLLADGLEPLRRCIDKAIASRRPVVLDLLAVDEIDRDAVRLLRDAHSRLGTRLRVVAERGGPVHLALKHAGVAHVLALHASRPAALAAAAPSGSARFTPAGAPAPRGQRWPSA
jgi:hypothetical protein